MADRLYWIIHHVDRWQTLLGALIALAAAIPTIRQLSHQIKLQRQAIELQGRQIEAESERHREASNRRGLAVRAQMPDALSGLLDYARGCLAYEMRDTQERPKTPSEEIGVLKQGIEFVDNVTSVAIFDLVSFYQVHNARLYSLGELGRDGDRERSERQYDTVRLAHYTLRLFEYARNEALSVSVAPPTRQDMVSALKNIVGLAHYLDREEDYAALVALIEKRHQVPAPLRPPPPGVI